MTGELYHSLLKRILKEVDWVSKFFLSFYFPFSLPMFYYESICYLKHILLA